MIIFSRQNNAQNIVWRVISAIFHCDFRRAAKISPFSPFGRLTQPLLQLLFAAIFSLPIYANLLAYHFDFYLPYLNAILALLALAAFINAPVRGRFFFGFFVGIFWFYWTGLSFRFTPQPWLGVGAVLFVACGYGLVAWFLLFFENKFFRAASLSVASFISIFGFDWFVPDALFAFSIFGVDKFSFVLIALVIAVLSVKNLGKWRFLAAFLLFFALDFDTAPRDLPPLKIKIAETNVPQDAKWVRDNQAAIFSENYREIKAAIAQGYDVIVLPEVAFPIILNDVFSAAVMDKLRDLSREITIITGAMRWAAVQDSAAEGTPAGQNGRGGENGENGRENAQGQSENGAKNAKSTREAVYNATFAFKNGESRHADKVFLAPFGEYMPVPLFVADLFSRATGVNVAQFDKNALTPQDLDAWGVVFRNAICYEATTRAVYADFPPLVLMTTNNAWFAPSIEPILQLSLVKYYARRYGATVLVAANASKSGVITPNARLGLVARGW